MSTRDPSAGVEAQRAASELARREREARALRENLLRRKAQARARRDGDAVDAPPAPSLRPDGDQS
jgi:hypothetical protein